jgi:hypothetical protein
VAEWLKAPHSKDGRQCCVEYHCVPLSQCFQAIPEAVSMLNPGVYHCVLRSLGPKLGPAPDYFISNTCRRRIASERVGPPVRVSGRGLDDVWPGFSVAAFKKTNDCKIFVPIAGTIPKALLTFPP